MSENNIKFVVNFKVSAISTITKLVEAHEKSGKLLILTFMTPFGTVSGTVLPYNKQQNGNIFDLNDLMKNVAFDEYLASFEDDEIPTNFVPEYNFLVLGDVKIKPYSETKNEYFYEQFVLFADHIIGFTF